jgi:trans-2-enoyl-CoA reductase
MKKLSRRTVAAGAVGLLLGLGGCKELAKGMKHAAATREEIKNELGVDSNVSFQINNDRKTVTVKLSSKPKGDDKEIKQKVIDIVNKKFGEVDEVVVEL